MRQSTRRAWPRPCCRSARAGCCLAVPTPTRRSSTGSSSTSSAAAGCASAAARRSPSPATSGRSRSARAACCWSGTRTGCCARSPTPAGTAATSCCRAARGPAQRDHLPVPLLDLRAGRRRCASRRASRTGEASTSRAAGLSSCPSPSGTAGLRRRLRRRAAPLADAPRRLDALVAPYEPERLVIAGRHDYDVDGQLEDPHRELPRVLPLPDDPPGAVRGQPAEERRELSSCRRTGSAAGWTCATAWPPCRWTARSPGVPLRGPGRARACARSSTSTSSRTCCSACTRTT